ncbi:sodium-dependent proline transporter-like [Haliotis rufescens]|uniref:sodium-dependent proline transporter-like n=1 Tax=Haliotis rufescens TaxID=6454 RepID=UPI001EAFFE8A|nr:sodium-dependent proline transporter-like [Haliotis rufescens]XP_048254830.1 sodium-dependent proline transporter-like [Haliotis rufescens]
MPQQERREKASQPGQREVWTHKREYILSQIGYSVGLGTFWRFPYLCNRNGGGAFLIPYFSGILLCAVPLFFLEVSIGQFSSRSAAHVWAVCPLFKGIGLSQAIVCFTCSISYNLIIVWTLYYLYKSFWPTLPWTTCNNWWNTALCVNDLGSNTTHSDHYLNYTAGNVPGGTGAWRKPNETLTASEEFWQYNALRVSNGFDTLGSVQTHLVICAVFSWVILFFCMMFGVKSVGKVVYVTAVMPFLLLTVLLIRSCMMPGSADGILYFLKPDFSHLLSVQVWLEALLQGFYSMNTTYGGLITMGSFNPFHNNCFRDVVLITLIGELSSIFCGLVVFSTLGFMANEAQLPISEVVTSGSGLGFIIYPEAIAKLPFPQLWAVLFFFTLLTVGIDSMFGTVEAVISGVLETRPSPHQQNRVMVTLCVCLISFLLTIPFVTEGGVYFFQLLDWYSSSFNTLVIGFLECVVIYWIYGSEKFSKDIERMVGGRAPTVMRLLSSYVTPVILFAALIYSLVGYDPPSYGNYLYPEYAKIIGILVTVGFSLPIPVIFMNECLKRKGTLQQRLCLASRPSPDWGPLCGEDGYQTDGQRENTAIGLISRTDIPN